MPVRPATARVIYIEKELSVSTNDLAEYQLKYNRMGSFQHTNLNTICLTDEYYQTYIDTEQNLIIFWWIFGKLNLI
jgi:hypothetical protein